MMITTSKGRKRVEKERRQLEEENRKLARTVQELQYRLDETTEGQKPVLTDFTTLANELQKMLRLEVFLTVTSDRDKSNVLTEENQLVIMKCALMIGIKICLIQ